MKHYKVVTSQDTVLWGTTTTVESTGFMGEHHQLFFVFAQETSG